MSAPDDRTRRRRYLFGWGLQTLASMAAVAGVLWTLIAAGVVVPGTREALLSVLLLWATASTLAAVYQRRRYALGAAGELRRSAPSGPASEALTHASFVAFYGPLLLGPRLVADRGPGHDCLTSAMVLLALCSVSGLAGPTSERVKVYAYPTNAVPVLGAVFVLGLSLLAIGSWMRLLGGTS